MRAGGEWGNRMRWLADITDSKPQEVVRKRESWHAAVHVVAERLDLMAEQK